MTSTPNDLDAPIHPKPTRTRWVLCLWLCGLSGILYLDRICMSQAVKPIMAELDLTKTQMSYVMMAFSLAYGLFEVPTGRMGDKSGSRAVLTRIVVWWSVFTGLTGACSGLLTLMLVRFCFGAGEAGAFPNAARVIARWFPVRERGRVQGLMLASAQAGAMIAPLGAAWLIREIGWRYSFGAFGLIGVVWAIGFWAWFRDDPANHPGVNQQELDKINADRVPPILVHEPIPWAAVFSNTGVLTLGLIMIFGAFYTYFFYSWLPTYLTEARGLENVEAGTLASIILGGSAVGMLIGGFLADLIPNRSSHPLTARRYLSVFSYLTAAVCMYAGLISENPNFLAVFWAVSFGAMHVTLPNWWSVAIPQCGKHVGSLFGLMNGVGVIGVMASQWFVGFYADLRARQGYSGREQWDPLFYVYMGVLVLAAITWWCYRFVPLKREETFGETK